MKNFTVIIYGFITASIFTMVMQYKEINKLNKDLFETSSITSVLLRHSDSLLIANEMLMNDFYAYVSFRDAIAYMESGNNYKAINHFIKVDSISQEVQHFYALGKYQFMKSTAYSLGYDINPNDLENTPDHFPEVVQDMLFNRWMEKVEHEIYNRNLHKFIDTNYKSIPITKSGMYAASHLAGVGGLYAYLINNENRNDGNTSVTDYIIKFNNFNF